MIATTCPTAEELDALSTGRLPDEESDELLAHVRGCQACRSELETLPDGEDSLIASLRSLDQVQPFDDEPGCRVAVSKALGALALASDGSAGGDLEFLPRVIGEYEIVRPLGRGGMGSVYLARHTKLGREVALKALAGHRLAEPRTRERFEAEMRAVGKLSHPNIVTAHDAREVEGTAVLVMEYIDGLDLGQIVDRTGPLATADACEIGRRVAVALAYTSGQGFVHRDVKPSNIMLSRSGEVKLLDLGLARLQEDDLERGVTGTGQTMGTADYIAPEQVSDSRSVDVRADIYALGCTLFKLLSGTAPFAGAEHATAFAKMTAHVSEDPPSLADRAPGAPAPLVKLVDSMLAKDSSQRPRTPQTIAERLAAFTRNSDLEEVVRRAETVGPADSQPGIISNSPSDSRDQTLPLFRRKVPLRVAVAGGVLGLLVGICLGILVKIEYPDGTVVRVQAPPGSKVTLEEGASERATDAQIGAPTGEVTPASTEFAPLQFAVLVEEDQANAERIERAKEVLAQGYPARAVVTELGMWYPVADDVQVPIEAIQKGQRYGLARQDRHGLILWDEVRGKISGTSTRSDGQNVLTFHFRREELAERVNVVSKSNLGRQLALIVDNEIIAAPKIISEISSQARFTGAFSNEQIQYLMDALNGLVDVEPDRSSVATEPRVNAASDATTQLQGLWHIASVSVGGKEVTSLNESVIAFDGTTYYTAADTVVTGGGRFTLGQDGFKTIHMHDELAREKRLPNVSGIYRELPGERIEIHSIQTADAPLPTSFDLDDPPPTLVVSTLQRLGDVPKTHEEALALAEGKNNKLAEAIIRISTALQDPPSSREAPTVEDGADAAKQQRTREKLEAIGMAFHQFHDTYKKFPGSSNQTGAPPRYDAGKIEPFSWRIAILPYLGETELHEAYRFDEPWDSEHNRKLLTKMPPAYQSPFRGDRDEPIPVGETHYQGFVGVVDVRQTAAGGAGPPPQVLPLTVVQTALGADGGFSLPEFTDGTSPTLLIAETRSSVPWTKPQDIPFESPEDAKEVQPFGYAPLNFVTADGAVHAMDPIDWEKLAALITRNGGEPVRP